jgi:hypothetical protein
LNSTTSILDHIARESFDSDLSENRADVMQVVTMIGYIDDDGENDNYSNMTYNSYGLFKVCFLVWNIIFTFNGKYYLRNIYIILNISN